MKKIIISGALIGICSSLGYALLVIVYLIPEKYMENNLQESACVFAHEEMYYAPAGVVLDNFTDALMLLTAGYQTPEKSFIAALNATRYTSPEKMPPDLLVDIYTGKQCSKDLHTIHYQRYWHGYLVYLKPLLVFFTLQQIRYILSVVQLLLFTAITILLTVQGRHYYAYALLAFWIFLHPLATMSSLQFTNVLLVTFSGVLCIVTYSRFWKRTSPRWSFVFLIIGCLTSYLDLLTYPLVSLGIPLLVWISLGNNHTLSSAFTATLRLSLSWVAGYTGMWAAKWLIGSLILGKNLFSTTFSSILFRVSGDIPWADGYTSADVLLRQISNALQLPVICILSGLGIVLASALVRGKFRFYPFTVIYLLIGMYPCLWYILLQNHSYIHAIMTYRTLGISLFALCLFTLQNSQSTASTATGCCREQ